MSQIKYAKSIFCVVVAMESRTVAFSVLWERIMKTTILLKITWSLGGECFLEVRSVRRRMSGHNLRRRCLAGSSSANGNYFNAMTQRLHNCGAMTFAAIDCRRAVFTSVHLSQGLLLFDCALVRHARNDAAERNMRAFRIAETNDESGQD